MTDSLTGPRNRVLTKLEGVTGGPAQFMARCPTHEDKRASLSVGLGDDGEVLLRCHGGCRTEDVLAKLGLEFRDLFRDSGDGIRWIRGFTYLSESGVPLYRVRRGESSKGEKRWLTEQSDPHGWQKGYRGPKVLYRLPDLLQNPTDVIWLTEGERDADSLAQVGLIATTVANGSWSRVDTTALTGRQVAIVVDADPTGWRRGSAAVEAVQAAGAKIVGVVQPADGCKDITDHLASVGNLSGLREVDLSTEPPPQAGWSTLRSAFRETGESYFVRLPSAVLLALLQRGELKPEDFAVYTLCEERAGQSGIARLTIGDVSDLLRIERHAAGKSLQRLTEVRLVEQQKRGRWRVWNPSQQSRAGEVDRTLHYRSRRERPTPPSPSKPSIKTPESGNVDAIQQRPSGAAPTFPGELSGTVGAAQVVTAPAPGNSAGFQGGPDRQWLAC